jgi:TrmH family RNA methyltransferase
LAFTDLTVTPSLKRYKKEFDHSYTFGVFPTLELLHHRPADMISVLLHSKGERSEGVQKIEQIAAQHRIRTEVNDSAIERISTQENNWAVGVFRKYDEPLNPTADHVALVNPSDMGNLGTILRTMLAFAVTDLALIRPAVDVFDPRAVRASMGALFQVRFAYFDTFEDYADQFDHALYPFITGAASTIASTRFDAPYTLIFGSESAGLPDSFREIGTPVGIPITDRVDSLNLAVAVGIGLYGARNNK